MLSESHIFYSNSTTTRTGLEPDIPRVLASEPCVVNSSICHVNRYRLLYESHSYMLSRRLVNSLVTAVAVRLLFYAAVTTVLWHPIVFDDLDHLQMAPEAWTLARSGPMVASSREARFRQLPVIEGFPLVR